MRKESPGEVQVEVKLAAVVCAAVRQMGLQCPARAGVFNRHTGSRQVDVRLVDDFDGMLRTAGGEVDFVVDAPDFVTHRASKHCPILSQWHGG